MTTMPTIHPTARPDFDGTYVGHLDIWKQRPIVVMGEAAIEKTRVTYEGTFFFSDHSPFVRYRPRGKRKFVDLCEIDRIASGALTRVEEDLVPAVLPRVPVRQPRTVHAKKTMRETIRNGREMLRDLEQAVIAGRWEDAENLAFDLEALASTLKCDARENAEGSQQ